jgi:hypothetical protein
MRTPLALSLLLAAAAPGAVGALEAVSASAEEVDRCVRSNMPIETSLQTVQMVARDRIGSERTLRSKIYWKRFDDGFSRVLARFSEPTDLDGAGFLLLEKEGRNDMFLYMPEVRKVRRVNAQTMKGSIFGTDFSYEDFERLQGVSGPETLERREDSTLEGGRVVLVIAGEPPPDAGSGYERVVSFVDPDTCIPLKTEMYEPGDKLRKVLTVDAESIEQHGESWIPRRMVMRDLRDGTETSLVVESVEFGAKIRDRMFSLTELEKSDRRF